MTEDERPRKLRGGETMKLQSCAQDYHPLRKFVLEPTPPTGPHGAVHTELWAACRFCDRADKLFTFCVDIEGDGRHRRISPTRRDYRAALTRWRKAKRAEERLNRKAKHQRSPA